MKKANLFFYCCYFLIIPASAFATDTKIAETTIYSTFHAVPENNKILFSKLFLDIVAMIPTHIVF